jgi:ABC-type branched-subunit amino acid transport system ATPase component
MTVAGELSIRGATKRFGGLVAVSDLSLDVPMGRIHGLIGPNGAGKSTTIGLISGFLRPNSGGITLGARDLTRMTPSAIARLGISRTFQQATPLGGMSVFENILVGMHTRYRAGIASVLIRAPAARREANTLARARRTRMRATSPLVSCVSCRSRARSRCGRAFSCWTNRPQGSTTSSATSSRRLSADFAIRAWECCSSTTTCPSSFRCAIG